MNSTKDLVGTIARLAKTDYEFFELGASKPQYMHLFRHSYYFNRKTRDLPF